MSGVLPCIKVYCTLALVHIHMYRRKLAARPMNLFTCEHKLECLIYRQCSTHKASMRKECVRVGPQGGIFLCKVCLCRYLCLYGGMKQVHVVHPLQKLPEVQAVGSCSLSISGNAKVRNFPYNYMRSTTDICRTRLLFARLRVQPCLRQYHHSRSVAYTSFASGTERYDTFQRFIPTPCFRRTVAKQGLGTGKQVSCPVQRSMDALSNWVRTVPNVYLEKVQINICPVQLLVEASQTASRRRETAPIEQDA